MSLVVAEPDEVGLRPPSGSSAVSNLLTVLGEFVLPRPGGAWTATLVEALGALGAAEKNARQALARASERGWITGERRGRKVRWTLTAEGRSLLAEGTERIYGFLADSDTWDGRWLVVIFAVPEDQRTYRHRLRRRLGFAGFGFPAPGVAVCPHTGREGQARRALEESGAAGGALVFRGEGGSLDGGGDLVGRAWDLGSLAAGYRDFASRFEHLRPRDEREAFVALAGLVHEWRRFPFLDPELPAVLLPEGWPGRRAKEVFDARHLDWTPAAQAWFDAVESGGA